MFLNQELIDSVLFYDMPAEMEFKPKQKLIKLHFDCATIKDSSHPLFKNRADMSLGKGVLTIHDWTELRVFEITPEEEIRELNQNEIEILNYILIVEQSNVSVIIDGFGIDTDIPQRWKLTKAKYFGEFEEYWSPKSR